jgi:hypothetical protein
VRNIFTTALVGTLAAAALVLSACSDDESPNAVPSAEPPDQLAALARAGLTASYTATYALEATGTPANSGIVTIRRTPNAYRVDIVSKGSDAFLVHNPRGTYSCEQKPGKPATCFTVAGAGKPIPAAFDAGVQKVFNTYLTTFADQASAYDVSIVDAQPANGALPEADCFSVLPGTDSPTPQVAAGTYCFSGDGIPVHVVFPSGTLDLRSLAVETPDATFLVPPATPTPLPGA